MGPGTVRCNADVLGELRLRTGKSSRRPPGFGVWLTSKLYTRRFSLHPSELTSDSNVLIARVRVRFDAVDLSTMVHPQGLEGILARFGPLALA